MSIPRALVVAFVLVALPATAAPDGTYQLIRREMDLRIHSETEGRLEVRDTLRLASVKERVAKIQYKIPRVGPLFRFEVAHCPCCLAGARAITGIPGVIQAVLQWYKDGVTASVDQPAKTPDEGSSSRCTAPVAVVVRESTNDYVVEVMGGRPTVQVTYSFAVVGRGVIERNLPGLSAADIRSSFRFSIPCLDLGHGTDAQVAVTVLPDVRFSSPTPRQKAAGITGPVGEDIDDRRYWSTAVLKLADGSQAVDVTPTLGLGKMEAFHQHLGVWDGPPEISRPLYVTNLAIVFPPPTSDQHGFVDVAVDVAASRRVWMQDTLAQLDDAPGVSLLSAYLAGVPPVAIDNYEPPLSLAADRGKAEDLLRLVAKQGSSHPVVLFTDRPQEYPSLLARLRPGRHAVVHLVDVRREHATRWRRVLGRESSDAAAFESKGGMWIEFGSVGEALDNLWDHLVWPRRIDDLRLTVDDVPFDVSNYVASVFTPSLGAAAKTLPSSLPLGTSVSAVLLQGRPVKIPSRWRLSGLVWGKPIKWQSKLSDSDLPASLLHITGALEQLARPLRVPIQKYLVEWGEILPEAPQVWTVPAPHMWTSRTPQ